MWLFDMPSAVSGLSSLLLFSATLHAHHRAAGIMCYIHVHVVSGAFEDFLYCPISCSFCSAQMIHPSRVPISLCTKYFHRLSLNISVPQILWALQ